MKFILPRLAFTALIIFHSTMCLGATVAQEDLRKGLGRVVAGFDPVATGFGSVPAFFSNAGQTSQKDASASIAGRVTHSGKPVADITVVASIEEAYGKRILGRATSDNDGNYRITGLRAGRITVAPAAQAFVKASSGSNQGSQTLNVASGDLITNIDFKLTRGAVITGRITDTAGTPLIGERINIQQTNSDMSGVVFAAISGGRNSTDDRGIYRIYGLPPGSYKVSVGEAKPDRSNGMFRGGSQYIQTFYPGVSEEAKATILELKEGTEIKDVDIRATKGARGFSVSGRVVDATSNQPAANLHVGYSVDEESKEGIGSMSFSPAATDANGRFTISGLQPGRYQAFTFGARLENATYSEPVKFEIADGDVTGVEIKLSRGATISGHAVLENTQDPAVAAALLTVNLYAFADQKVARTPSFSRTPIKADGSFKLTGLAPGKVRITMMGFPTPPKGLKLKRVELNGVEQRHGIEVTQGADVNDVRLVFGYGSGSLRGTVKVAGGIPEGAMFVIVIAQTPADSDSFRQGIEVDARGHFVAEDVPPGTFELTLNAALNHKPLPGYSPLKRTITITDGVATEIDLEVDLSNRKGGSN